MTNITSQQATFSMRVLLLFSGCGVLIFSIVSMFYLGVEKGGPALIIVYCVLSLFLFSAARVIGPIVFIAFLIGGLLSFFVAIYWESFYGSIYFQGAFSDDYQYDVLWSKGYYETHGLLPFELMGYVNSAGGAARDQHNSLAYVYFIVILRWIGDALGGYSTFLPRLANCFLLVQISFLSVRLFVENSDLDRAKVREQQLLFLCIFFSPVLLSISVHVFRDVLVGYLILLFYCEAIRSRVRIRSFLTVLCILVILYFLRAPVAGVLLIYMLLIAFFRSSKAGKVLILVMASPILMVLIFNVGTIFELTSRYYSTYQQLNIQRFGLAGQEVFGTPLPLGLFPRIVFFSLTPAPNFSSVYQTWVSISTIFQVLYFSALFYSLLDRGIRFELRFLFIAMFSSFILISGTFRHVFMFYPLAVVLVFLHLKGNIFHIGAIIGSFKNLVVFPVFLVAAAVVIVIW